MKYAIYYFDSYFKNAYNFLLLFQLKTGEENFDI